MQSLPLPTKFLKVITVRDKNFEVYLDTKAIESQVEQIASALDTDYGNTTPFFLGVLNGSFMFISDLLKKYEKPCEIGFIKAASYEGMHSTGKVNFTGMESLDIENRDVIIVEDIVDTGNTLKANGLEPRDLIAHSSARLVVSRVAMKTRYHQIAPIISRLQQWAETQACN